MSTDDVEAHGRNLGNTNEDVADDDVAAHARLDGGTGNTNEDVADDDVAAHARLDGGALNTNEDAVSEDD